MIFSHEIHRVWHLLLGSRILYRQTNKFKFLQKSKRDRTAIVDDALKYVKGMQEKLEKFRLKGIGVKKISTISNRLLEPEHENLLACSPAELPSRLGKLTAATGAAREQGTEISVITSHDERLGSDSSLLMEPQVQVFIGCGNDVLISFSCKPRGNLISCVLQALEMFCLEVKQYTFSKILKELVHCNFMTKVPTQIHDPVLTNFFDFFQECLLPGNTD